MIFLYCLLVLFSANAMCKSISLQEKQQFIATLKTDENGQPLHQFSSAATTHDSLKWFGERFAQGLNCLSLLYEIEERAALHILPDGLSQNQLFLDACNNLSKSIHKELWSLAGLVGGTDYLLTMMAQLPTETAYDFLVTHVGIDENGKPLSLDYEVMDSACLPEWGAYMVHHAKYVFAESKAEQRASIEIIGQFNAGLAQHLQKLLQP